MVCPFCEKKAIHLGDNDYEDYGLDGEGIVSNGSCRNKKCKVDTILIYIDYGKESE